VPPVDFDALDPRFRWMRDYLAAVAPPGRLPGRQHVDPVDFPTLLPFVNLVDVERDAGTLVFRYRLVGTINAERAGVDMTGHIIGSGILPAFAARIARNMTRVVETCAPVFDRFPSPHPHREFIISERVYFPLARDGATVDMLLSLFAYPGDTDTRPVALPPPRTR
jgi:hypothetical protein